MEKEKANNLNFPSKNWRASTANLYKKERRLFNLIRMLAAPSRKDSTPSITIFKLMASFRSLSMGPAKKTSNYSSAHSSNCEETPNRNPPCQKNKKMEKMRKRKFQKWKKCIPKKKRIRIKKLGEEIWWHWLEIKKNYQRSKKNLPILSSPKTSKNSVRFILATCLICFWTKYSLLPVSASPIASYRKNFKVLFWKTYQK